MIRAASSSLSRRLMTIWLCPGWDAKVASALTSAKDYGRFSKACGASLRMKGLLPLQLRDVDGIEDERKGIVSVFAGPVPRVVLFETVAHEIEGAQLALTAWLADGIEPAEIGIFVRTPELVERARQAATGVAGAIGVTVGPMHLAKGLEFRAVAILACNEGTLPLDERVSQAADEAELDDIYETERRLLYVACTRARDHLYISGEKPGSEYLSDLGIAEILCPEARRNDGAACEQ